MNLRRKHELDPETQTPKKDVDEESLGHKEKSSIKLFGVWELNNYTVYQQFAICVFGVFFLYLSHGYFQESIYSTPGFKFGFYASLFDFFIFIILSLIQLGITTKEIPNEVPKKEFVIISVALMVSLGFGNSALAYLNYPTKVLFKSAKLIPTMILGIWITKRIYSAMEYAGAFLLCAGLTAFTIGGASISPSFQMTGILLVSVSVVSESILSNVQEKIFANYHCKLLEMVLFSNLISFALMFVVVLVKGELLEATYFCLERPKVMFALFGEAFVGYLGVHFYLALIKRFGAVVTIIVASLRKVFTIILSFFIFPKPFTWMYLIGGLMVFGSMFLNVYVKNQYEIKSYLQKREYHAKRGYFQKVAQFV